MDSLKARLDEINRLRKQAMSSAHFLEMVHEHEMAIAHELSSPDLPVRRKKVGKKKQERLSDIYVEIEEHPPIYA
ncbi:hypothetical protein [Vibrio chagasii]|uniref:hypothetical protein n=1 Tax=Vibrio chagasii TaxID=170679 RepID=UPI00228430E6|nr:hypothetical protein [Vibrio chagasii]MCY9828808.1 hypothetical protein [Vibrio chagasii]